MANMRAFVDAEQSREVAEGTSKKRDREDGGEDAAGAPAAKKVQSTVDIDATAAIDSKKRTRDDGGEGEDAAPPAKKVDAKTDAETATES